MKTWMTLAELAHARLPGLPGTRQGLAALAEREAWAARKGQCRRRLGRGGGLEFSIDLLPDEARAELASRLVTPAAPGLPTAVRDQLPADQQARRDARMWVLAAVEAFARENGLKAKPADLLFADAYNSGNISAPHWVRETVSKASREQLRTWRKLRENYGADALGADTRGPRNFLDTALDGAVRTTCLAVIAAKPHASARHVHALIEHRFRDRLDRIPSVRDVQRAIARWEREYANELLRLRDPDGYRSRVEFAAVGSTVAEGLNDLWQIDASPADVMLKGKRRHSVYVAIDIWSRRVIVLVTETPRASAVALLIRKCILAWGVPRRIKTDNGSDFVAHATQRLFTSLGIEIERSAAFDPKSKGNVERAIGTFQRDLAICPGFIGHSVADRKIIENRKAFNQRLGTSDEDVFDVQMDLAEFQAWCDDWAAHIYGTAVHSALKGRSPMLKAASWAGAVRRIDDPEALDILLAPIAGGGGIRRVAKTGVRINGEHYYTADVMPGTDVLVRMDPADMGKALLFTPDGETWLGQAVCPALAGLDPVATMREVKAAQKAHEQERLAEVRREMRQIKPRDMADALLAQGRRRAEAVVPFPQRTESYSSPGLRAAAEAVIRQDAAPPAPPADLAARRAAIEAAVPTRHREPPMPTESPKMRFRRALTFEAMIGDGHALPEADAAWLAAYQREPEYRAHRLIFDDVGMAMFA